MNIIERFSKYDLILKLLIVFIFFILFFVILNTIKTIRNKEYLTNMNPTFVSYDNNNLHDNFYSNIYDRLHNNDNKNTVIINIIKNNCNVKNTSTILDIGCGTGEIVSALKEFNIIGLDKSESMIELCNKKYPNNNFILDDILNTNKVNYNYEFTHILCLNYTIYYFEDRETFFKNTYDLLSLNGMLIIHLVDKNIMNRTINACRINNFNPSKYLKDGPIKSKIDFENFEYTCNYTIENNKGYIDETFILNDNSIRKNNHKLNLDNNKVILNEAKKYGYIVDGQIKIKDNDGEYIFILKKNI